ncbi:MAG: NUDIX hydrolase, partial [Flavobacteriales bacterium]
MSGYLAYVNDRPISFLSMKEAGAHRLQPGALIAAEEDLTFPQLLDQLSGKAAPTAVVYLCNDPHSSWMRFVGQFTLSVAAGGVVDDGEGCILVIRRRGKWDLPKGKLDYDETPEHAAVREVMEECGLKQVELGHPIGITFHTYTERGKNVLKKTHWYRMNTSDRDLVPQAEEDI